MRLRIDRDSQRICRNGWKIRCESVRIENYAGIRERLVQRNVQIAYLGSFSNLKRSYVESTGIAARRIESGSTGAGRYLIGCPAGTVVGESVIAEGDAYARGGRSVGRGGIVLEEYVVIQRSSRIDFRLISNFRDRYREGVRRECYRNYAGLYEQHR